jgi:hypothetical protein
MRIRIKTDSRTVRDDGCNFAVYMRIRISTDKQNSHENECNFAHNEKKDMTATLLFNWENDNDS